MERKEDMKGRPFNYLRPSFIAAVEERPNAPCWPLKELTGRGAPEAVGLHCMQITAASKSTDKQPFIHTRHTFTFPVQGKDER